MKNVNTLEIRAISKSSADHRMGRAGRTSLGECYRLYSEEDYADMRDSSEPEILRSTLASAIVKLYLESEIFTHSSLYNLRTRKRWTRLLGAVKDGELTAW